MNKSCYKNYHSRGPSFLRSPRSEDENYQNGHARLPFEGKNFVCVKKCASCFSNSHTSECGLRRKERPFNLLLIIFFGYTVAKSSKTYAYSKSGLVSSTTFSFTGSTGFSTFFLSNVAGSRIVH